MGGLGDFAVAAPGERHLRFLSLGTLSSLRRSGGVRVRDALEAGVMRWHILAAVEVAFYSGVGIRRPVVLGEELYVALLGAGLWFSG
jgi:hypothetical protein